MERNGRPSVAALALFLMSAIHADQGLAHRSGCHRWHSCESDHGTYVCGDTGHCGGCFDNAYCKGGAPRTRDRAQASPVAPGAQRLVAPPREAPVMAPPLPPTVEPTPSAAALRACAALDDPGERLRCFDKLTRPSQVVEKKREAVIASPSRTAAPATLGSAQTRRQSTPAASAQPVKPDPMLACARIHEPAVQLECFDRVPARQKGRAIH